MSKIENQSVLTSKFQLPDQSEKEIETKSTVSSTEYMTDSFTKLRTSVKSYGMADEDILQTLTLTNNSEYDITVTNIAETISMAGSYKPNSISIDGEERPDLDLMKGFGLENPIKGSGGTTEITFILTISDKPTSDIVTSLTTITYNVNEREGMIEKSNILELSIVDEKITFTKTSDKSTVARGESLTFVHEIKNEGSTKNTDLFFKDSLPDGVTFDVGSVLVDDVEQASYNPIEGFSLGDLEVGSSIKVQFSVTVN